MNYLNIKNLSISYEKVTVFNRFSHSFDCGLHWIKGYNGSGKSTLLKALCGIIPVPENTVKVMGHDITTQALKAKSALCYVADKPEVYPFMSGYQYLQLIAEIKGETLNQKLEDWLDEVNLSPFKDTPFSDMSFGTRRKFTLASCLIGNPDVILLDEPFNGLDDNTCEKLMQWLFEVKEDKCVLIASHNQPITAQQFTSMIELP